MTNRKFIEALTAIPNFKGDKERQVEHAYNDMLMDAFPGISISNPFKCDGYFQLTTKNGKVGDVIIEYKYDEELTSDAGRAKVLAQVLFYLKKIEKSEFPIPNVVMVGDVNECFVLHVNPLLKYLDFEGVDWGAAPSGAANKNPDLVLAISKDENLNTWIYDINERVDFSEIAKKIEDIIDNVQSLVHITEHNIDRTFEEFDEKVLKGKSKLSANDKVGVFMGCLVDSDNFYLHPKKSNILVANGEEIAVDGKYYVAFFKRYDQDVPPFEKRKLAEICDRLIEDTTRRKKGEFYTPTPFVDAAHKRIEKVLGENWKDEYVVWDCCCGTKNLTRDYVFNELYCSTLEQSELDISEKYNPPKDRSFQFDFLNDDFEKLPEGLKDAFRNKKKIVFLMNPPYATACNHGDSKKESLCQTKINALMKKDNYGRCSENLLAQFLYRCEKMKKDFGVDVSLAFFCKPIYLSGGTYGKFRDKFLKDFKYEDGFLFNAGYFADTSMNWGINFSIWTSGETTDKNNFKHDLVDANENGEIVKVGEKNIYNTDGLEPMGDWVVEKKKKNLVEWLPLTNGINVKNDGKIRGTKMDSNALGYFHNNANSVCYNPQYVNLFTSVFASVNGCEYYPSNFLRCTCAFTARKLVHGNWINDKDEYLAPDTTNPNFHQFEVDSVIYSLFHSSSQQSSLRQIDYKGKKWDIKNEFFWMDKSEIMSLANEHKLDDIYNDASTASDRFVYLWLKDHYDELSSEAKAVLDKATDLVRKSFKYRELFDMEKPEYQCGKCWDAGFYQLKQIWKTYMNADFDEFKSLYKKLSEKMLPMVYELGFLRK